MATKPVYIRNDEGDNINAATEEAIVLLRRIANALEPSSTRDQSQRQRIVVDALTTTSGVFVSGSVAANAFAAGSFAAGSLDVGVMGSPSGMREMVMQMARNSYSNGIRNKLSWS